MNASCRLVCLLPLAISLAAPASAQGAPAPEVLAATIPAPTVPGLPWERSVRSVAKAEAPPVIDGALDDPAWRTATHAAGFYRALGDAPFAQQTEAWICADRTYLYVAFHCQDSQPQLIRAEQTQRGGNLELDDYVGVDIDSQNSRRGFSTFLVSAGGVQYEHLEGGTADNITWAGDWKAAVARVPDGWTAEMAIPFGLLRYPKGTHAMGLVLMRKLARETTSEVWPYLPPQGTDPNVEAQYMDAFAGLNPPSLAPRPVFLPYTLAIAGTDSRVRSGLDVKYPLSKTLTGVASLFPDFETVEQAVTDISFSYTEKFLTDRRPFFAEGADFLPTYDLFYSRRIGEIDGGAKLVGKSGKTAIGVLGAAKTGSDARDFGLLNVERQIGLFNSIGLSAVSDGGRDQDANHVARLYGTYSVKTGPVRLSLSGHQTYSWLGGQAKGQESLLRLNTDIVPGRPYVYLDYNDIAPDFESRLGYVPERNIRGYFLRARQYNQFDKGPVAMYEAYVTTDNYDRHTGGFYRASTFAGGMVQNQKGYGLFAEVGRGHRNGYVPEDTSGTRYQDRIHTVQLSWGNRTLLKRGSVMEQFGRQAGQDYNFLTIGQGFVLSEPLTGTLSFGRVKIGAVRQTQSILNVSYRLDKETALGGRVIRQGADTNLFFSYGRQVRSGADIFILYGEPDPLKATRTRNKITVKLLYPM